MNVYFSCSITGGRQDENAYQAIVNAMLAGGHEVPTQGLSQPDSLKQELLLTPEEVYTRDKDWIEKCDALVAEVSTPSHGVGYEIAYALSCGKPVLCCYRNDAQVSKMITGNTNPNMQTHSYSMMSQATSIVLAFLSELDQE